MCSSVGTGALDTALGPTLPNRPARDVLDIVRGLKPETTEPGVVPPDEGVRFWLGCACDLRLSHAREFSRIGSRVFDPEGALERARPEVLLD